MTTAADIHDRRFLSIEGAAHYSSTSISTIRRWLREKKLRPHRPNRKVLIDRAELEQLILASAG
jgi:excisionase family DNA binding protein